MKINKSEQRGVSKYDWLISKHSFSFGDYYNPKNIEFGALKVLNEDFIAPGKGFGMHPHENMEIITVMLRGTLEHKDSMGNKGIIEPEEIQVMSAGTGIMHSEFNNSKEKTHLLQIWIEPNKFNLKPNYNQKNIKINKNKLQIIVSKEEGLNINQNAVISIGKFEKDNEVKYSLKNKNNGIFVFLISGKIKIAKGFLESGDSAEITKDNNLTLKTKEDSLILIIEVPT